MPIRTPILAQLYARAVIPAHEALDLDSPAARVLVLGTVAHESRGGQFIVQWPNGPALGYPQIEPATATDTLREVMAKSPRRYTIIEGMQSGADAVQQIATNALYAVALCRLKYWIAPDALPPAHDLPAIAAYWKQHYNTPKGKGTVAQWLASFAQWIGTPADLFAAGGGLAI